VTHTAHLPRSQFTCRTFRKWEEVSIRRAAIEKGNLNTNERSFPFAVYPVIAGEEGLIALDLVKPIGIR
jgi:hypothetical protein